MKKYTKAEVMSMILNAKKSNSWVWTRYGGKIRAKKANIRIVKAPNGGYTAVATKRKR